MKVQSTFYIDFISKTVDVLLISSFITKQMPKLLIFDAFTLLICKKNVAIYALLRCKIFSLKIWLCKIFDKFHVWGRVAFVSLPREFRSLILKNFLRGNEEYWVQREWRGCWSPSCSHWCPPPVSLSSLQFKWGEAIRKLNIENYEKRIF